jgi:hypothetical protein
MQCNICFYFQGLPWLAIEMGDSKLPKNYIIFFIAKSLNCVSKCLGLNGSWSSFAFLFLLSHSLHPSIAAHFWFIPGVPGIVAFIDICWLLNIELQNFWASYKSQVATAYLCMHFCSNYIGWSNQGKYYGIEMHCAKQDVATWLYDKANIFRFNIFVWKHMQTG